MLIEDAAEEYLTELQVRRMTQKTQRSYKNNLHLFIKWCENI